MDNQRPNQSVYLPSFPTGAFSNRSPLLPVQSRSVGVDIPVSTPDIDAVFDGLNMKHTVKDSWRRRDGYTSIFNGAANPAKLVSFFSYINSNAIVQVADQNTSIRDITNASDIVASKTAGQSYFLSVGNVLYATVPGTATHIKRIGTGTAKRWGISAATTAPTATPGADGSGIVARIGFRWCYAYKDSVDAHIGSCSALSANSGKVGNASNLKKFTISGPRSTDARVDTVVIFRTMDGGSTFFQVTTLANPGAGNFSYDDKTKDKNLNTAILAPLNNVNDPPLDGMTIVINHAGRQWGALGSKLYFSGGNDALTGVPEECWNPLDFFSFVQDITALRSTSQGILIFTHTDVWIIRGLVRTEFYRTLLRSNLGVASQDCVAADGDILYVYTANRQLLRITDSVEDVGYPIQDNLTANYEPIQTKIAIHRNGTLGSVWIASLTSNKLREFNMTIETWSTEYQLTGVSTITGIGSLITSIAAGSYAVDLWVGIIDGSANRRIWKLDNTVATDNGSNYSSVYLTLGAFVFAPPGETVSFESIYVEIGPSTVTKPDITFAPQEIDVTLNSATITGSDAGVVNEPPQEAAATSLKGLRYYFNRTSKDRNLRLTPVKITFASESVFTELYSAGIGILP